MKKCAKCGSEFSCGASTGSCWCQSMKVSEAVLDNLRVTYVDCLCPKCLEALSEITET